MERLRRVSFHSGQILGRARGELAEVDTCRFSCQCVPPDRESPLVSSRRLICLGFFFVAVALLPGQEPPRRAAWTTSRLHGTPEPPPPYQARRCFPKLSFKEPVLLVPLPGTDRLVVGELDG